MSASCFGNWWIWGKTGNMMQSNTFTTRGWVSSAFWPRTRDVPAPAMKLFLLPTGDATSELTVYAQVFTRLLFKMRRFSVLSYFCDIWTFRKFCCIYFFLVLNLEPAFWYLLWSALIPHNGWSFWETVNCLLPMLLRKFYYPGFVWVLGFRLWICMFITCGHARCQCVLK